MILGAARRALQTTRRQLSTSSDALPKIPKPPTAALAKRSQLLRDVRSQRPFWVKSLPALASRWRCTSRRRRRGARSFCAGKLSRIASPVVYTQCTKYLDALEDLDLLSAKEMRVVFEKSEWDLVPLDEHVERLTASRNLLAARLREVEDEDVEGHCWPGAC